MVITHKQRCFERWDEQFEQIFAAAWCLSSSGLGLEALLREFGIRPREQKWFTEWMGSRNGHPPMTPPMRQHTSLHEAAHAVVAEILVPGSVARAACYREQQQNPNFGKDEHPHGRTARFLRGKVEYEERTSRESFEKDAIEYTSRRVAISQIAGVMEKKFGFENGTGADGDDTVVEHHISLAESDAERDALQSRASELVTRVSESPLVEQAVREVADRLYRDEVVNGTEIRGIVAANISAAEEALFRCLK